MATRKQRRAQFRTVLLLIVAVIAVLGVTMVVTKVVSNRPDPEPETVTLDARVNDTSVEVSPYVVAEVGVKPEEGEVASIDVGAEDTLSLAIPEVVHDHDWALLTIYDDPAYNDEQYFTANERTDVEIPGSVENKDKDSTEKPRLVVVEVKSVLIGHNDDGEETPYNVTWSIHTQPES
ncbi:hypothetical protein CCICO_08530 [Corynebacterium ciconiae DSM 44920]|uniref:DUF2771 domain-containing protein n=1 Tax=Corynebacterium ciconiae TaxID=227319 RepID=UPI00035C6A66|nr:DUF2771 domain-containing protein [Corynebacterium ciconiae]WKD61718.1 hypothetical protein CCICO_08530 [Corynebacterium ciconiae DSM 44920]